MQISNCRGCSSSSIELFLDLGNLPFANGLVEKQSIKSKTYPLGLCFCHDCSLVQLSYTANPEELFSNYLWVTGTSKTARENAVFLCETLHKNYGKFDSWICEVASNDGTFLKPFQSLGYEVLGIDPAENIAKIANESGVPTLCNFFTEDLAIRILNERGPSSLIMARNVFAHVPDLLDFANGLATLSGENGIVVIEFHYGAEILNGMQYDSIYHEHISYLTATSVKPILKNAGLDIIELLEGPISGGSLIVIAKKNTKIRSLSVEKIMAKEDTIGLNKYSTWINYANNVHQHKQKFIKLIQKYSDKKIFAYGASARSSTLLNFCEIDSTNIEAIADANPLKQGLYTAGNNLPIISPDEVFSQNPKCIIVLAWNFKNEIINLFKEKYNFSGDLIFPLPNEPYVLTI
jgi:hypothetical protein